MTVTITAGGEIEVGVNSTADYDNVSVTGLSGGGFVVTWDVESTGNDTDVYQRLYDGAGNPPGDAAVVNTTTAGQQEDSFVTALSGGGYLVVWCATGSGSGYDIYFQQYDASGNQIGDETLVNSNTKTGDQWKPVVAGLKDGGWAISWETSTDGGGSGVYQQRYTADGKVITEVQTETNYGSYYYGEQSWVYDADRGEWFPPAQLPSGVYYEWDGTLTTSTSGGQSVDHWLYADHDYNVYDGDGDIIRTVRTGDVIGAYIKSWSYNSVAVPESVVNTTTANDQGTPSIAAMTDGGWVVAWASAYQDDTSSNYDGIYMQRYDADGGKVGGEILVNSTTADDQDAPAIAGLADGGWVVTWESFGQTHNGSYDIYQQHYNANGVKVGTETLVNTTTYNHQKDPATVGLANGGWVVVWAGYGDGNNSNMDIYQQVYNAQGHAIGGESRVNSYMDYDQQHPEVTALADGGWVVTWESDQYYAYGTAQHAVLAREFHADGSVADNAPVLVSAIADQQATEDKKWNFIVPSSTFSDVDGDTLTYTATLSDGSKLPSWLTFDAATRTFSGTPPVNYNGAISLKITASDGSLSASDTFKLDVTPVNDAPTGIMLSGTSVKENVAAGTVIGTLTGTDPDAGDTLTFSLTSNPDHAFTIKGGKLVIASGVKVDFETQSSYHITVRATDGGGLHVDQSFTIAVTDVAETIKGTAKSDTLSGGIGADLLDGLDGNDRLYGYAGLDKLYGGSGNDTLTGGAGNDRLYGGLDKDVLIGGSGQDIFVFNTKLGSSNVDKIDDFSVKDDTIWLDDDIFTKLGAVGDLKSVAFHTGSKAHDADDRIIYDSASGKLWYDADGNKRGGVAAVEFANLDPGLKLTAADFDLIA